MINRLMDRLININIRKWLLGIIEQREIEHIINNPETSMFWTRLLGVIKPNTSLNDPVCKDNISKILELFKIGSIIIGHTPQSFVKNKDINSTCSNKVWRVDNGSSSAFDKFDEKTKKGSINPNRRTQYLTIINDNKYYICDSKGCKKEIIT